ncbi:OmpW family protein [Parvibaculum sp.]|uniref:OmpW/AlkL family protein n=1 Tax=Parvibaculum sp. TaxID=2024848 RepID=UPI002731FE9D|nr:OmpW family protein [Parvibaculum sp.]MDP1627573.1 OmpW family protein [Parvibaculum sp.]MDP2148752.1 OmpW family protein [Parvibaculum sp.]MDP3328724.1 OmpW family protein [Parvibaculum sp.]
MKTYRAGVAAIALVAGVSAAVPAHAEFAGKSAGDFMVRARAIAVVPDEDASTTIGGNVSISNDVVPEIDFSYFITDNIALELIAATTKHDVSHNAGIDLGEVSLLPPTLTLQYHFMPKERFSPYVGAGINYTIFYNEDAAPGSAVTDIDYDNAFGYALQVGVDYALSDNWYANVDVKKLFLNTDVSMNGGTITADVDIDPWIIGVGVGYRF